MVLILHVGHIRKALPHKALRKVRGGRRRDWPNRFFEPESRKGAPEPGAPFGVKRATP
jgi:hypothetical protein